MFFCMIPYTVTSPVVFSKNHTYLMFSVAVFLWHPICNQLFVNLIFKISCQCHALASPVVTLLTHTVCFFSIVFFHDAPHLRITCGPLRKSDKIGQGCFFYGPQFTMNIFEHLIFQG